MEVSVAGTVVAYRAFRFSFSVLVFLLILYTVFHKKTNQYLITHNFENFGRFSFFTLRLTSDYVMN